MSGTPFEIREVLFAVVYPWRNIARRERVTLEDPDGCFWFAAYKKDFLAGFAALVVNAKGAAARFKSDWIRPEFRCQGVHRLLLEHRDSQCRAQGIAIATAFCTPDSARNYLKMGFQQERINPHEIAFLRKRYIR